MAFIDKIKNNKNKQIKKQIEDFKQLFTSYVGPRSIMFATYSEFPETGISSKLYFDLEEKILYYWENQYIPVDAMLIANTVLDGGEA